MCNNKVFKLYNASLPKEGIMSLIWHNLSFDGSVIEFFGYLQFLNNIWYLVYTNVFRGFGILIVVLIVNWRWQCIFITEYSFQSIVAAPMFPFKPSDFTQRPPFSRAFLYCSTSSLSLSFCIFSQHESIHKTQEHASYSNWYLFAWPHAHIW